MSSTPIKRRSRTSGATRKRTVARPGKAEPTLTPEVRSILDRFRLDDVVSHLLRRAHFAAEEKFASEFADERITPRQKATLIAIYQSPGLNQNMLAGHLFLDRNTVAEMVKRLVARRLIERRSSPEDRRAYKLFLAPDGAAVLDRVMVRDGALERAILQALPKADQKRFMGYLRQIVDTLEA
ncbi:MAG: MarR family transcriptional regulator [Bradyrhizobiaceae bacterium PARB1]|jgi:DNA-binding MarR family transcriptional regulator|nr:MAG: MarR family transcriptional regulator [Bradyrhizobiaceae bacterium PARB1]